MQWAFFWHLMPMLWHQPYIIYMVSQPFCRGGSVSLIRSKILPKNQALVNWFLTLKLKGITGIILYGPPVSIYMYCSNVKSCIRWYTSSHLAFLPLLSIVPALVMSSTQTYQPSVSDAVQAICMSKWYAWGLGNPIVNTRECKNN